MQGWDLVLDGASAIKNVVDTKKVKIDDFLNDILGSGWKDYAPIAWLKDSKSNEIFDHISFLDSLLLMHWESCMSHIPKIYISS